MDRQYLGKNKSTNTPELQVLLVPFLLDPYCLHLKKKISKILGNISIRIELRVVYQPPKRRESDVPFKEYCVPRHLCSAIVYKVALPGEVL